MGAAPYLREACAAGVFEFIRFYMMGLHSADASGSRLGRRRATGRGGARRGIGAAGFFFGSANATSDARGRRTARAALARRRGLFVLQLRLRRLGAVRRDEVALEAVAARCGIRALVTREALAGTVRQQVASAIA
jgi:hypothetical protein